MIKFIWKHLFGDMYNAPKLSAIDVIQLHTNGLLTFQEARFNLGFTWFEEDTEKVFNSIKDVIQSQKGIAI